MLFSTIIDDALVHIAVKNPSDETDPKDHMFGLRTLNRIIDSYNTQNLIISYLEDKTHIMPNTGWKQSIEIGHGLEIDDVAPISIQGLFWRQAGTDYPSKEMTHNTWSTIGWKTASGIPSRHYVQRMSGKNLKIYFDQVPLENLELHLMQVSPYTGKDENGYEYTPTDDIEFAYGVEKMIVLRLAVELASSYEITPSPELMALAAEAENVVKTKNYRPMVQSGDMGLTGGRNKHSSRSNRARY